MNKRTGNLGYGRRSDTVEETASNIETESQKSQNFQEITVIVESIFNIDESKVKEIIVKVEFKGELLNQSLPIPVTRNEADVKLISTINVGNTSPKLIDEILSNPVLFTILENIRPSTTSASINNQSPNVDSKRRVSTANALRPGSFTVLGSCNLDIGSLATGEKTVKRTLLVEPDNKDMPFEVKTWVKLPRLDVLASSGEAPLISETNKKFNNTVGITIESVYNLPEYILNGSIFEASIPMPTVVDKSGKLRFPNGVTVMKDNFPQRKKWLALSHIDLAGARSVHRIRQSYCDVLSSLPRYVDIGNEIKNSRRVIQWNTWKNCLLIKNDFTYFYTKIMKYRTWPIEIMMPVKSKELLPKDKTSKPDKKSKQAPSTSSVQTDHFMAFLDLSPLLHPGVTKVRVASQLYTYSQTELLNRFGPDFFSEFGYVSQSQHSFQPTGIRRKSESVRSKSSTREAEEQHFDSSPALVYGEFDGPTFIIVEVELSRPFIAKRSLESLESVLKANLCLKEKVKPKTTTFGLLKDNFTHCLINMMSILTEEYNKYCLRNPRKDSDFSEISLEFQRYLTTQENFYRIKASLERAVVDVIKEKYGAVKQYEEKIPEIYVYLVNEMHRISNKCLVDPNERHKFYDDNIQLYAEEAMEEGDYELAEEYLFVKLSRNTSNPDYWLDCAVFYVKLNKYEEALEAVREALGLNFHHQIGLLMYALLASKILNASIAETTFGILLTKYPTFIEGWLSLSLFFSLLSNFEGAQLALQEAIKLQCEGTVEEAPEEEEHDEFTCKVHACKGNVQKAIKYGVGSFVDGASCSEPLSWTISFIQSNNIYLKATVLLQKLGFYEHASLALAEELLSGSKDGKISHQYIYYTSVNNYLQGRYEEAIPLLQKIVKDYARDCFVWSLLGHCYYKLKNHADAISCYEYVKDSFNRPHDIHLVFSRVGFYYLQIRKFLCAKKVFMSACKYSPTPKTWKGVGIACLEMKELEDAEIAFSEANYLDNKDPETWAYLALTNALLRRLDLFHQCCHEAKKRNLKNSELLRKIQACASMHGMEKEEF